MTTFICYHFPFDILETFAHYHQGSLKRLHVQCRRCGRQIRPNRRERLQYPGLRYPENPHGEVQCIFNKIDRVVEWFPHLNSLGLNLPRQQGSVYHALSSLSRLQKLRHLVLNIPLTPAELRAVRNPAWDMTGQRIRQSDPQPGPEISADFCKGIFNYMFGEQERFLY